MSSEKPLPVTTQPGVANPAYNGQQSAMIPVANPIAGVPIGLEYLSQVNQLLIKQQVELFEVVTNFETKNKYKVLNTFGQNVFDAVEDSGCCSRQCCGPNRGFVMKLSDNTGRHVIDCDRPFKCNCGPCWPCCLHKMEVKSAISQETFGYVKQVWSCVQARMDIYDHADNKVFEISGVCCGINCCSDVNFHIKDVHGTEVGVLQKQWTGCCTEAFTDADNFSLSFPMDLDARLKATLLGAVFLLDFLYFENPPNNDSGNGH